MERFLWLRGVVCLGLPEGGFGFVSSLHSFRFRGVVSSVSHWVMSTASLRHCLKSGPDRRTELQDPVLRRGREGEDHDEERKANPDLMPEISLSGLRVS